MGLLEDVIGGVLNQTTRSGGQATRGGGMSPMMMAMMAFLAYRTLSGQKGGRTASAPDAGAGGRGDILGDLLGGGRAGGGHAGRSGSGLDELSDIVDRFEQSGQGDVARSWVGRGENQPVSPSQMNALLDADTLDQLQAATGLDHDELLAGLAQTLPGVVDQLTPDGRLPTPQEWQRFGR